MHLRKPVSWRHKRTAGTVYIVSVLSRLIYEGKFMTYIVVCNAESVVKVMSPQRMCRRSFGSIFQC